MMMVKTIAWWARALRQTLFLNYVLLFEVRVDAFCFSWHWLEISCKGECSGNKLPVPSPPPIFLVPSAWSPDHSSVCWPGRSGCAPGVLSYMTRKLQRPSQTRVTYALNDSRSITPIGEGAAGRGTLPGSPCREQVDQRLCIDRRDSSAGHWTPGWTGAGQPTHKSRVWANIASHRLALAAISME